MLDFGGDYLVKQVRPANGVTCALMTDDATVKCFGKGADGTIGPIA